MTPAFTITKIKDLPEPWKGYKRGWYRCRHCGNYAYNDYLPYSLSNPIYTTSCGHDFRYDYQGVPAREGIHGAAVQRWGQK